MGKIRQYPWEEGRRGHEDNSAVNAAPNQDSVPRLLTPLLPDRKQVANRNQAPCEEARDKSGPEDLRDV